MQMLNTIRQSNQNKLKRHSSISSSPNTPSPKLDSAEPRDGVVLSSSSGYGAKKALKTGVRAAGIGLAAAGVPIWIALGTGSAALGGLGLIGAGALTLAGNGLGVAMQVSQLKAVKRLEAAGFTHVNRPIPGGSDEVAVPIPAVKEKSIKRAAFLAKVGATTASGFAAVGAALVGAPIALSLVLGAPMMALFASSGKEAVKELWDHTKAKKALKADVKDFSKRVDARLAGLKESNPELFEKGKRKTIGGVYTELTKLVEASVLGSNQHKKSLNEALAHLSEQKLPGIETFKQELSALNVRVAEGHNKRYLESDEAKQAQSDPRVRARCKENGIPADQVEAHINRVVGKYSKGLSLSKSEQRSCNVFVASKQLHATEQQLGDRLFSHLTSSLQNGTTPQALDALANEIAYRTGKPFSGQDMLRVANDLATLLPPTEK